MGRESLIPLVEDIEKFNGRWKEALFNARSKEALRESSGKGKTKSASINSSRGIFEPGAKGRAEEVARKMLGEMDQMTNQVGGIAGRASKEPSQLSEMDRRKQIMKERLGGQRPTVQRDEGFEPGE